jgi:predicted nucleic acid-binding Zn ribbon protein
MAEKLVNILSDKFRRKDELSKQLQIVKVLDLYKLELSKLHPLDREIRPLSLKNGVLTVKAPSSVAAHQLRLHEAEWLAKINHNLGGTIVKRVSYRF